MSLTSSSQVALAKDVVYSREGGRKKLGRDHAEASLRQTSRFMYGCALGNDRIDL